MNRSTGCILSCLLLSVSAIHAEEPPLGFVRLDEVQAGDSPPQLRSHEILDLIDRRILEYTANTATSKTKALEDAADAPESREREAAVRQGAASFENYCTQCHDASRSTSQTRTLGKWRSTVRRMAKKSGADIPETEIEPIATYLASRTAAVDKSASDEDPSPESISDGLNIFGTLSPSWRGGHRGDVLENGGFLAQTWIGVEWQPTGPLRARASACVSCHRGREPGTPVELAEAAVTLNLSEYFIDRCCDKTSQLELEAGRFIVPFGTIAERSHPGALRTVTPPLIFNMGQNVHRRHIGEVVLPMPYSDEGARLLGSFKLTNSINSTFDAYVVNGLHGGNFGIDFFNSRQYLDNNGEPAVGGRATLGNRNLRLGASVMSGRHNPEGPGSNDRSLNYKLFGTDIVWRYGNALRVQAEYALRNTDYVAGGSRLDEEVLGWAIEAELQLVADSDISIIFRWDTLDRRSNRVPPGSALTDPIFVVERFTWGVNFGLPGGSRLLINIEHWLTPENLSQVDVAGLRWVATF